LELPLGVDQQQLIQFVGYLFVDDMDKIQTRHNIQATKNNMQVLMQAALDLWNQGLLATGGALVPEKSFWYSINFCWCIGKWSYTITKHS